MAMRNRTMVAVTSMGRPAQYNAMSNAAKILPPLAAVALSALFLALAWWQLERARGKEELLQLYAERAAKAPLELGAMALGAGAVKFAPVTVRGRFEPRLQFFVDNVVVGGRAGVEVVTPFKPERGEVRVLVNRGWLVWAHRAQLPPAPAPGGVLTLHGRAEAPSTGRLRLGGDDPPPPGPWAELNVQKFAALAPYSVQPFVLRLGRGAEGDGLLRRMPRPDDSWVHRHRAYALQWFALAAALWTGCALWWRRRRRQWR